MPSTDGLVKVGRGGKLYLVKPDGNRAERTAFVAGQTVGVTAGILWAPIKVLMIAGQEAARGAGETSFGQGVKYGFHTVDRGIDVQIESVRSRNKKIEEIRLDLVANKVLNVREATQLSDAALRKMYAESKVPSNWEFDDPENSPIKTTANNSTCEEHAEYQNA